MPSRESWMMGVAAIAILAMVRSFSDPTDAAACAFLALMGLAVGSPWDDHA